MPWEGPERFSRAPGIKIKVSHRVVLRVNKDTEEKERERERERRERLIERVKERVREMR